MSAAFTLDFSGPETPCDFPGCTRGSFHEGDHVLASKPKPIAWSYDRHCVVCGVPFTVLNAEATQIFDTCGSQECLLHYARHSAGTAPQLCRCPQRRYAHELAIHFELRTESYNPKFKFRWPWSLCLSARLEPSCERKEA